MAFLIMIIILHFYQRERHKRSLMTPRLTREERESASEIIRSFKASPPHHHHHKIHCITFGDGLFREQSTQLAETLRREHGHYLDAVTCFHMDEMDNDFKTQHNDILSQKRGLGYWLWKPYFCERYWRTQMNEGDVLIYLDGGLLVYDDLQSFVVRAIQSPSGGFTFDQPTLQQQFTKGDVFHVMNMDMETYGPLLQRWAAIFFVQKREHVNGQFFREWLDYCVVPGLIDDSPSTRATDHPSFHARYHRHDQSIFSLLAWRYKFAVDSCTDYWPVSRKRPSGYWWQKLKHDVL
jgi:hypothetical protein